MTAYENKENKKQFFKKGVQHEHMFIKELTK